jgi:hypothetical protein
MPLKVFPLAPYYDDFNQEKNYQRILFKPGYSIQARELTQLQTSIQAQIDRFGRHVFKDGSSVIGGEASLDTAFAFVKIESGFDYSSGLPYDSVTQSANGNFIGRTLTGEFTGITATVIDYTPYIDENNPLTLYIHYTSSNSETTLNAAGIDKSFYAQEVLVLSQTPEEIAAADEPFRVKVKAANTLPIGKGTRVTVSEGVFFVSGNFVYTPQSSVILSKYNPVGSGRIVYAVTEGIVTAGEGEASSLFDNSIGTPNTAAPGADRYQISLELQVQPYQFADRTENNIIQLMVIKDGRVVSKARTQYSELGDILAQRTFEESGNYTVRPFQINIRQYLNANSNGGLYTADQIGSNVRNLGGLTAAAYGEKRLAVGIEPSIAYVNGYRIELLDTKYVEVPKAREKDTFDGAVLNALVGNYVYITLATNSGLPDINGFTRITLKNSGSTTIGFARARAMTPSGVGVYRLYLFDIQMNAGQSFSSTATLESSVDGYDFSGNISGSAILQETANNSLLFKLPVDVVDDVSDVAYYTLRSYDDVVSSGTWTKSGDTNEFFPQGDAADYIAVDTTTGLRYTPSTAPSAGAEHPTTRNNTLTLTFNSATNGHTVRVIALARRRKARKVKTLTTPEPLNITSPSNTISLGVTDLFEVTAIYDSENPTQNATTLSKNVTENYIVDNGQRDNFYDVAKIQLKATASAPTGKLRIEFKHFTHSAGDYFSRNSYLIDYSLIPAFQSSKGLIQLRDAIDFRPSKNGADETTFAGGDLTSMVSPNSLFEADLDYYLSRVDKIFVDKKGNFGVVEGISAISPTPPQDPNDSMVLYTIRLGAYTFGGEDIIPTMVDNKRYTMRDIGKIEKRVSKLEYYTSLSLLEKDTTDRQILANDGIAQRYKNGFVVDSFYGHSIGAVTHPDYRCSIDKANGRLRPSFHQDNVRLTWNSSPLSNTTNVRKSSSLITLDYTQQALISQPYASMAEFVNPYNVFTWKGDMTLSPESDEWKETQRRPEVVIDQSGTYDSLRYGAEEDGVIGTVWNEWQDNWTGVSSESAITNIDNDYNSYKRTSTTTLTTTTRTEQARSGIRTSVVPDTVTTDMGDRTVEINFVPFIRSRMIYFRADGLKPNTKLHAFFDNTLVDQYVHEEAYQVYSSRTDNTNYINATQHPDYVTGTLLETDEAGRIAGSFIIPSTSSVKFKTGVRIFRLTDSETNDRVKESTGAEAVYDARGLLETKENVVVSTRVPRITRTQIGENRTVSNTSRSTTSSETDIQRSPLPPATIVSPVDTNTTTPNVGPSPEVQPPPAPWTWLLAPPWLDNSVGAPSVIVDETVPPGETTYTDYTEVPPDTESLISPPEAIVIPVVEEDNTPTETTLVPPSEPWVWDVFSQDAHQIKWVDPLAQSFLIDLQGGAFITSLDLYFKDKDENLPITLDIRVMENGIPTPRVVPFSVVKASADNILVSEDATVPTRFNFEAPVHLLQGVEYCFVLISNSDKYKVWVSEVGGYDITNPAFRITSQPHLGVMFKSQNASTWTPDQTRDIKFVMNRAVFYSTGTVVLNELPLPSRALKVNPLTTTSSSRDVIVFHKNHGHTNGSKVTISGITSAVNGIPIIELNKTHTVSDVEIDSYVITVATTSATSSGLSGGSAVVATENRMFDVLNPIVQQLILPDTDLYWSVQTTQGKSLAGGESFGELVASEDAPYVKVNDNTFFTTPRVILSEPERTNIPGLNNSFILEGTLVSLRNNISPVIDLDRLSLITISNRIDNPYIPSSGSTLGDDENEVRNPISEETSVGGSALAKYITRKVELNDPASALKIYFLANRPAASDIKVYYKVAYHPDVDFEALGWKEGQPDAEIPISDDPNNYLEIEYTIGDNVDELDGNFTAFAIKVVFISSNSSQIPTLRDFRAVAVT